MVDLTLRTSHSTDCRVRGGRGSIAQLGAWLADLLPPPRKVALISDRNVAAFCLEAAESRLEAAGYATHSILIPPGESSKSLKIVGNVWDRLLAFGLERTSVVVALGGGVVGDVAGFAAATLLRGVELVQVPTSLVGQVDSAIGGKNGLDRPLGKNLVGTFHPPRLVVIDPDLLATLPERDFRGGLAEVVKYGFLRDPTLLQKLREVGELERLRARADVVDEVVARCVAIKAEIVRKDERETGERTLLNFGHTTGHAIEAAGGYRDLQHGEAVAIGMVAAAFLGVELGVSSPTLPAEVSELLELYGLPLTTTCAPDDLLPRLGHDKKRRGGKSRWVLVTRPGEACLVEDPPLEAVKRALEAVHVAPARSESEAS
jgi:3-dehydroquinate synthase